MIILSLFLGVLFLIKVSPQNLRYVSSEVETMTGHKGSASAPHLMGRDVKYMPDSLLDPEQKKQKIAINYVDSVDVVAWRRTDSLYNRLGIHPPHVRPLPGPDLNAPLEYSEQERYYDHAGEAHKICKGTGNGSSDPVSRSGIPAIARQDHRPPANGRLFDGSSPGNCSRATGWAGSLPKSLFAAWHWISRGNILCLFRPLTGISGISIWRCIYFISPAMRLPIPC